MKATSTSNTSFVRSQKYIVDIFSFVFVVVAKNDIVLSF